MSARRLLAVLACVPTLALAQATPPAPDGGRVDLGGGMRWLGADLQPAAHGRFAWQMDAQWALGIELGMSLRTDETSPVLWVTTFGFSLAWHLRGLGAVLPYAVVGVGYQLIALDAGGYAEGTTGTFSTGLGVYLPITGRLGLVVEDRWVFARAGVGEGGERLGFGGNMLWAGLVLTFEPEPPLGRRSG